MPRQHLENLISRLHDSLAGNETSPQQQAWLAELQKHAHAEGEPEPHELTPDETANLLLESLEAEHPHAAALVREIIETLGRLGL